VIVIGLVLACLAAGVHGYIFYLESLAWTSARARATFGTGSREQAEPLKELAFNQGFYNLFLAVVTVIGVVVTVAGSPAVGLTMVFVGTGSMVAAGLVLLISSPAKASAALKQLTVPALAIIALIIGLLV
jgi:putative membrane protein